MKNLKILYNTKILYKVESKKLYLKYSSELNFLNFLSFSLQNL